MNNAWDVRPYEVPSVFIIINEWTSAVTGNTSSDIAEYQFYASEEAARGALADHAKIYGLELEPDAFSFSLEDHTPTISFEEYYIQELIKG